MQGHYNLSLREIRWELWVDWLGFE
jgi:hypothetical protein